MVWRFEKRNTNLYEIVSNTCIDMLHFFVQGYFFRLLTFILFFYFGLLLGFACVLLKKKNRNFLPQKHAKVFFNNTHAKPRSSPK